MLTISKPTNDTYGHQAGDNCLYEVAQGIKRAVKRPADIAFRYGGEEFAVVLPLTKGQGAIKVAEGIHEQIRDLQIQHSGSKVGETVSLSLGVSSVIPYGNLTVHSLIATADDALYDAKLKGRSQVVYRSVEQDRP